MHDAVPLTYNHTIAEGAQKYAQWMKDNDEFEHSEPEKRYGQGENLYLSSSTDVGNSAETSVKWYAEEANYDYDNPDESSGVYGHFTQMVWKASLQIGCGNADEYVVCRYSPAGN